MSKPYPVLCLSSVSHGYSQGTQKISILENATLDVRQGECVALVAPSGTGKSTLLHISGLLERPQGGQIEITGQAMMDASEAIRTETRRQKIGFMYQFHYLLPQFTALENIILPQKIAGKSSQDARCYALDLLEFVGLKNRACHRPGMLSGGEQQRVALCRALANKPIILLADEPTGNLDADTSERVFRFMMDLVREQGLAAMIATHNLEMATRMDRMVTIKGGKIQAYQTEGNPS